LGASRFQVKRQFVRERESSSAARNSGAGFWICQACARERYCKSSARAVSATNSKETGRVLSPCSMCTWLSPAYQPLLRRSTVRCKTNLTSLECPSTRSSSFSARWVSKPCVTRMRVCPGGSCFVNTPEQRKPALNESFSRTSLPLESVISTVQGARAPLCASVTKPHKVASCARIACAVQSHANITPQSFITTRWGNRCELSVKSGKRSSSVGIRLECVALAISLPPPFVHQAGQALVLLQQ